MTKDKTFTIPFNRVELNWLYRQLVSRKDNCEAIIKTYSGDAISKTKATEEQLNQLLEAQNSIEGLQSLTQMISDTLANGERNRGRIANMRSDLEEAIELVDEEDAKEEARKRIADLPKEETYRISFDRTTIKFTLRLLESDLQKFRAHVIPTYEKTPEEEFKDPIMRKSYWVNKARKSKDILDNLKTRLEKAL